MTEHNNLGAASSVVAKTPPVNTCGSCKFTKLVPQDVTKRFCHGLPPTPVLTPVNKGQLAIQMIHPIVATGDEACALFKHRIIADGNGGG